jgi:hypothetical protein
MEEEKVIEICKQVLIRLSKMDYERKGGTATEQLIFPNKFPSKKKYQEILEKVKKVPDNEKEILEKELFKYIRISEQELRQLFIEEFKKEYPEELKKLYYSIETPTKAKYSFSKPDKKDDDKITDIIKVNEDGQSALLDMCVFNKDKENTLKYNRILNIEFKHGNAPLEAIAKDVLKLMHEEQNGAFIFLLNNTNEGNSKGTLHNENDTGVLDKLYQSFEAFKNNWNGNKSIQLIILSLEQKKDDKGTPFLIDHTIKKDDLGKLKDTDGDAKVLLEEIQKLQEATLRDTKQSVKKEY